MCREKRTCRRYRIGLRKPDPGDAATLACRRGLQQIWGDRKKQHRRSLGQMSLSVSLHIYCLLAICKYKGAIWLSWGSTKARCAGEATVLFPEQIAPRNSKSQGTIDVQRIYVNMCRKHTATDSKRCKGSAFSQTLTHNWNVVFCKTLHFALVTSQREPCFLTRVKVDCVFVYQGLKDSLKIQ